MIYIGTDHGGYDFKEKLKSWMEENNIVFEDLGPDSFDPNDDYPDFIVPVAKKTVENPESLGIVLGRSGNGEAIAANKVKGTRAALCLNVEMAKKAKEHNNANVLSLGADYINFDQAKEIVEAFIKTPFSNDKRHVRRIEKIKEIENE